MKSVLNKNANQKHKEWKFPCLGRTLDGLTVLFVTSQGGFVVHDPFAQYSLGERAVWEIKDFQPLPSTESVTLQND